DQYLGMVDDKGRRGNFCSESCREKWSQAINQKNLKDFVNWFKKQNIKQITLTPEGELKIEYHKPNQGSTEKRFSNSQIVQNEQLKTAKRYLQQAEQKGLDRAKLENLEQKINDLKRISSTEKTNNKDLLIGLGIGLGIVVGLVVEAAGYLAAEIEIQLAQFQFILGEKRHLCNKFF
ncbi:2956_t:CDS:2, partial [Funneliformis geosporum]